MMNRQQTLRERLTEALGEPLDSGSSLHYNCPCCANDTGHHLTYTVKGDRELIYCCKGNHSLDNVLQAIGRGYKSPEGAHLRELPKNRTAYQELPTTYRTKNGFEKILCWYIYRNPSGRELYRVARTEKKSFPVLAVYDSGWAWGLKKEDRVPYRLDELINSTGVIVIVEGEKDADTVQANFFLPATTFGGAKNGFDKQWSKYFINRPVVIIQDNDEVGKEGGENTASALQGIASEVRTLVMPDVGEKGDVTDWFQMGGTREQFLQIIAEAPLYNTPIEVSVSEIDRQQNISLENPGEIPLEMIGCLPDFVKIAFEYYVSGSYKVQPALFLASLIATTGAMVGRKIRTENDTRSNIYTCGVLGTGLGKDWTRAVFHKPMSEARCQHYIGPEDFASDSGMMTAIKQQPSILFQIDEFGMVMNDITSAGNMNPHLKAVNRTLLRLYSQSSGFAKGKAYADGRDTMIRQPNACVYGTTTPETLWKSFTTDSVTDGLFPRILFFEGNNKPNNNKKKVVNTPPEMVKWFEFWHSFNVNSIITNSDSFEPDPVVIEWEREAEQALDWYRSETESKVRASERITNVWTRAAENCTKLALIASCWQNIGKPGRITMREVEWAIRLMDHCVAYLIYNIHTNVADSPFEELCNAMVNMMTKHRGSMTHSHLRRKLRAYNNNLFDSGIKSLIEQEILEQDTKSSGGRPTLIYRIKK